MRRNYKMRVSMYKCTRTCASGAANTKTSLGPEIYTPDSERLDPTGAFPPIEKRVCGVLHSHQKHMF